MDPDSATAFGFGGYRFSWGDHICAIFDDPQQQMELMSRFVAEGLRAVQLCVWVSPPGSAGRFRAALARIGGDLPSLEAASQLVVLADADFYLEGGVFQPARTMALLRTLLEQGRRDGYTTMRMATDVSCLRDERMDPTRWERFEADLTHEVSRLPAVLVCQYDRAQIPGSAVVAAFRTHPLVILGDRLYENPFVAVSGDAPEPSEVA